METEMEMETEAEGERRVGPGAQGWLCGLQRKAPHGTCPQEGRVGSEPGSAPSRHLQLSCCGVCTAHAEVGVHPSSQQLGSP